ncbi:MAG TPA: cytochrome c [Oceanobacillus sp.]|nr:cytochrome c [Oceanobacillus sp.]
MKRGFFAFICLLLLAGCGTEATPISITLVAPEDLPTPMFTDPALLDGQYNYNYYCGHCHGYNGEGQLASTIPRAREMGLHLVPPQDATGHTWEHPDQLLIRVIQDGIPNPLMQFPMPGFKDILTEQEIRNILAYIRLWWTEPQRAHQRGATRRWAELEQQFSVESTPEGTISP